MKIEITLDADQVEKLSNGKPIQIWFGNKEQEIEIIVNVLA